MVENFESFLHDCMAQGHTQIKLVPSVDAHGRIAFYAVGQCGPVSSETFEAVVEGKHVRRVEQYSKDCRADLSDTRCRAVPVSSPEPVWDDEDMGM